MSVKLASPAPCRRCGATLPKGYRAEKNSLGGGFVHTESCQRVERPVVATETQEPRATERQVAYALVVQQAASPSERRTVAELRAMSRDEISRHITIWQGL